MKFAKELEEDLVPEWRAKYLDYKAGKKRVKAVARAVQRAEASPRPAGQPQLPIRDFSLYGATNTFKPRTPHAKNGASPDPFDRWGDVAYTPLAASPAPNPEGKDSSSEDSEEGPYAKLKKTPPVPIRQRAAHSSSSAPVQYESFVPTPPTRHTMNSNFELPDPAIPPELSPATIAEETFKTHSHRDSDSNESPVFPRYRSLVVPRKPPTGRLSTWNTYKSGESSAPSPGMIRRMFSVGTPLTKSDSNRIDLTLMQVETVRLRQKEFFNWMDGELAKVEEFYKIKEDEAGERLKVLRDQLHEMRNRRIEEIVAAQRAKAHAKNSNSHSIPNGRSSESQDVEEDSSPDETDHLKQFLGPLGRVLDTAKAKALSSRFGPNSKALENMPTTPDWRSGQRRPRTGHIEEGRDYVRQDHPQEIVAYRAAKRKLKLALKEYYRGLELLKKINKKYDKAKSEVVDNHMHTRGNHKVATGKLRSSTDKRNDKSWIGIGAVFMIQAIDPTVAIYGGYLLGLYLFIWFCIDCKIWAQKKINYAFMAQFPCFFIFLQGLIMWLNFYIVGHLSEMYIYFPVILMCLTVLLIFFPAPVFFYRSRRWFVYSHWRLLLAGLYPVEFRDFFLGDMYCSLTYFMGNISLFFCLYAQHWSDPTKCNSSHSRLMGFFSTLPGIWRALQSLRRFHDTRNAFPHLANFGKYTATILYYVTLSLYRIEKTSRMQILFCVFAAVNAVYTSIWDLAMDWSLLQPRAKQFLLRDLRGYKNVWWYYGAMVLDVILRFNWVLYAIFTHDVQHSTLVSFFVALSEATRRGIWAIFRVENEHCSNVAHFKASRDIPLPYVLDEGRAGETFTPQSQTTGAQTIQESPTLARNRTRTSSALEAQESPGVSTLRRRPGFPPALSRIMADAHMQDFEKKRKPASTRGNDLNRSPHQDAAVASSDDDDDDEPDPLEVRDAEMYLRTTTSSDNQDSGNK
ncbi:signal transduction protein-like protein Syg1 [Xylogone sp. PMI_703]|nr:signal transduction protein-like protein Syg1 [Xylogone sp. PMI_703]